MSAAGIVLPKPPFYTRVHYRLEWEDSAKRAKFLTYAALILAIPLAISAVVGSATLLTVVEVTAATALITLVAVGILLKKASTAHTSFHKISPQAPRLDDDLIIEHSPEAIRGHQLDERGLSMLFGASSSDPKKTQLKLATYHLTDIHLEHLPIAFPNLTTLELVGCTKITNQGVQAVIEKLTSLVSLSLQNCTGITDTLLPKLQEHCPKLRRLTLSGCVQLQFAFPATDFLSHLEVVELNHCRKLPSAALLTWLQNLPYLVVLHVIHLELPTDFLQKCNYLHTLQSGGMALKHGNSELAYQPFLLALDSDSIRFSTISEDNLYLKNLRNRGESCLVKELAHLTALHSVAVILQSGAALKELPETLPHVDAFRIQGPLSAENLGHFGQACKKKTISLWLATTDPVQELENNPFGSLQFTALTLKNFPVAQPLLKKWLEQPDLKKLSVSGTIPTAQVDESKDQEYTDLKVQEKLLTLRIPGTLSASTWLNIFKTRKTSLHVQFKLPLEKALSFYQEIASKDLETYVSLIHVTFFPLHINAETAPFLKSFLKLLYGLRKVTLTFTDTKLLQEMLKECPTVSDMRISTPMTPEALSALKVCTNLSVLKVEKLDEALLDKFCEETTALPHLRQLQLSAFNAARKKLPHLYVENIHA